jgi:hypothetical protein
MSSWSILYVLSGHGTLPTHKVSLLRVSLQYVCTRSRPIGPATHHHRLRSSRQWQNRHQQSSEQSRPGSGTAGSIQRGIDTTRGHLRGSFLAMGSPRTSTGHISCVVLCQKLLGADWRGGTYCASAGFVTLLNSRQANVPPGLSTRCASRSTSAIDVTFRIPNAIV